MNPQARYFLPSQVRGVYRYDETFSETDAESYSRFVSGKLRFIPCSLSEKIKTSIAISDDYSHVQQEFCLQNIPANTSVRANRFFSRHPYFSNHANCDGADNYLEVHFVKKVLAPLLNDAGLAALVPQKEIGPYRADFALAGPDMKLAIEVDGFGKFKQRSDLDGFIERQNFITCEEGWKVIRFTYGQIMSTTSMTLKTLHNLLSRDRHFCRYLLSNKQNTANISLQSAGGEEKSVFEVVNGFYQVQDWFVEQALSTPDRDLISLCDAFKYEIPFVAFAISSLYDFLDTVASLVDIDFNLPHVRVYGAEIPHAWDSKLHPLVSVLAGENAHSIIVGANQVKELAPQLPLPLPRLDSIALRKGLSVEELHQRLAYLTREIFDYKDGSNRFQEKVLKRYFDGSDTLGISSTGSGKSFCFWLPSLLKPGLTIVVAPLKSLMRDQRLTLNNYGIASMEFINADVDAASKRRFMEEARLGYIRMLYIAPERLRMKGFMSELLRLQEFVPINLLAIDEAHCISEWGHDFRPSYLKIPSVREALSVAPNPVRLMALTATASKPVERDVAGILKLNCQETDTGSPGGIQEYGDIVRGANADRERFSYQVVTTENVDKSVVYQRVLRHDIPQALKQEASHNRFEALLKQTNTQNDKNIGLVFCMYADSHGKDTLHDGTSHFLFETMKLLESDVIHAPTQNPTQLFNHNAFSTGRVRAFSSKPPTLCPNCLSYRYVSSKAAAALQSDLAIEDESDHVRFNRSVAGQKTCCDCDHKFTLDTAETPKKWQKVLNKNQDDFKNSRFDLLVATKGFGMGIDKGSVRFVVHTSLSSGLESWYQEVGRAGRDNERAHIVLLADPPTAKCFDELSNMTIKAPACSWRGGCKHGRNSLCDYGKQHLFTVGSYPGAQTDARAALKVLDRLLFQKLENPDGPVLLKTSHDYISRYELMLYRLMLLGLVTDYSVSYGKVPCFEVVFPIEGIPQHAEDVIFWNNVMEARIASYTQQWGTSKWEPGDLSGIDMKSFKILPDLSQQPASPGYEFFQNVYNNLLHILAHTYSDVVKMRYDMLWELLRMATSDSCKRFHILPYFEQFGSVKESYKCGCCNVCSPEMDFADHVADREQNQTLEGSRRELERLINSNTLDINRLQQLVEVFKEYPTNTYIKARAILEGDPNNLPALYLTRAFSPPPELGANTRRLLETANNKLVPLDDLKILFESSESYHKPDILLLLNEQKTTCDSPEGWEFLLSEVEKLGNVNPQLEALHACLAFIQSVEALPDSTSALRTKAEKLEGIINA